MPRKAKASTTRPFNVLDLCRLMKLSLSPAQTVVLAAFYGLPLDADQRGCYFAITGRTQYQTGHAFQELTVVAGARGGKDSRIITPIAIFEALWGGHETRLHAGEYGVVAIVAQDRDAASVAFNYIRGQVLQHEILRNELAGEPLATELTFKNRIRVATFPCSLKSLRAYSICVGVLDELAFFRNDESGANADIEIVSSIRRGQISFGSHAKLLKVSTPFAKDGVLYDDFQHAWAQNDPDILVVRASSKLLNPTIALKTLDREKRRDPKRYAREYEAEFQDNVEQFIPEALITLAIVPGRESLPAQSGKLYIGGVDASGGGSCAFTIGIVMVDPSTKPDLIEVQIRGWERSREHALDLEGVVAEASSIFAAYGIHAVMSDKYSAGWSAQAFQRHGVTLIPAADKSSVYNELEPLFVSGRVQLLDHPVQNRQLSLLERRPRPGGKPLIGPPRGSFDDYSNSLALALVAAAENADLPPIDTSPQPDEIQQLQAVFPGFEFGDEFRVLR